MSSGYTQDTSNSIQEKKKGLYVCVLPTQTKQEREIPCHIDKEKKKKKGNKINRRIPARPFY
jgi:hypothetical protein